MNAPAFPATAQQCVASVKSGEVSALEITEIALARTAASDRQINS